MSAVAGTAFGGRPASARIGARGWIDLATVAGLTGIGLLGLGAAFDDLGYLRAGAIGLLLGLGVALLGVLLRLGPVATTLLALAGYVLLGSAAALPERAIAGIVPTTDSIVGLMVGSVFGWRDLLTIHAPVALPYYIDSVPYLLCWLVGLVSGSLALRWLPRRPRTAPRSALVLAGPVLVYFAGVLFGTDQPYLAATRGVVFASVALLWLGWRRRDRDAAIGTDRAVARRKLTGSLVLVLAAAVIGTGIGTALPPSPGSRFVLRQVVQPPFQPIDFASPLAGFRKYTKDLDSTALFRVEGIRAGQLIRLAAMDDYDGVTWGVAGAQEDLGGSGSFRLTSDRMSLPPLVTPADSQQMSVHVLGYSDVWMPGVGYATDVAAGHGIDGEAVRYNSDSGTAVDTAGLVSGDDYRLTVATQETVKDSVLAQTPVANVSQPQALVPDVVAAKAAEITKAASSPIAKLRAIESYLRSDGFFSHGAASDQAPSAAGHGADRMVEMMTAAHMVGDQEQYASLMALMVRSLGMPSRVVMGFAPKVAAGASDATVTGDNVTAWVEVPFTRVGWVSFMPTPDNPDVPQSQNPKPKTEPQPQVRQPPKTQNRSDDSTAASPVNQHDRKTPNPFVLPDWVLWTAVGVAVPLLLILVPLAIIALLKLLRRRRRRRMRPERSAVGAWDELVDASWELGWATPGGVTRSVAARSLGADTGLAPTALAERTDRLVFSGQQVAEDEARESWRQVDSTLDQLRRASGFRRRLLSRYRIGAAVRWTARAGASARARRTRGS